MFGSQVTLLAIPLAAVLTLDAGSFQMGLLSAASMLPWLLFALLNQFVLVLIMAAIIALAWFVASVVQLIVRPAPAGH